MRSALLCFVLFLGSQANKLQVDGLGSDDALIQQASDDAEIQKVRDEFRAYKAKKEEELEKLHKQIADIQNQANLDRQKDYKELLLAKKETAEKWQAEVKKAQDNDELQLQSTESSLTETMKKLVGKLKEELTATKAELESTKQQLGEANSVLKKSTAELKSVQSQLKDSQANQRGRWELAALQMPPQQDEIVQAQRQLDELKQELVRVRDQHEKEMKAARQELQDVQKEANAQKQAEYTQMLATKQRDSNDLDMKVRKAKEDDRLELAHLRQMVEDTNKQLADANEKAKKELIDVKLKDEHELKAVQTELDETKMSLEATQSKLNDLQEIETGQREQHLVWERLHQRNKKAKR